MATIQEQWRQRAAELQTQIDTLLANDAVNKPEVSAIHALAMRELLPALADLLDAIQGTQSVSNMTSKLSAMSARNNKFRMAGAQALATGDWSSFVKLVNDDVNGNDGGTASGSSNPSGSPGAGA